MYTRVRVCVNGDVKENIEAGENVFVKKFEIKEKV